MIRCLSTRFRNLLVGAAALATALGCSADLPEETGGAISDGSLVGELTAYMADYENRSELVHKLRDASGTERTLVFPTETDLTPGTRLKVWAAEEGDALRVIRYEVLPDSSFELQQQALVNAMPKPNRRWAFVLVNFGTGVNITEAQIRPRLFDPMLAGSIRSYFREVSYGIQDLEGEVFSLTTTAANACDTGVANRLRAMIPGQFTQYLWYFGARQMGCGWAGLAQVGSATRSAPHSWYNASNSCVVLVQEPGHNFGMVHSSSVRCTRDGVGVPLTLPGEVGTTCAHGEYGNPYDPMGRGCYHMNGPQKAYQDWLTGCNVVKVGSSGTFTLFPIEKACNGVQLLQIPLPAPRTYRFTSGAQVLSTVITSYFLELRTPVGFDFRPQAAGNLTPRVLVTISGDVRGANQSGGRNWMIDMTPETTTNGDGALPVGKEYADPAPDGPKFTVVSADMEKAVIRVTLSSGGGMPEAPGRGTCDNMMPFTAPGAETCNAPPPNVLAPATDAGAPPASPPDAAPEPPVMPDAGVPTGGGIDEPGTGGAGGLPAPPPAPRPASAGSDDAGGSTNAEPEIVSAGCGCRLVPEQSGGGALAFAGLLAFAMLIRRRRR